MSSSQPMIRLDDIHKMFEVNTSGIASLKTMLVWWKRRNRRVIHVLKGVSFDVMPGECVAAVGRNGAGKSTLLSLVARVYRPNSGHLKINGRIAPLLELGAGFHPDLTGYENIFFNGIILGLTGQEIERRLDEIVAFSELETHIHQPTRTYSSGMLARLGFSIAVHVDAEILLIDEVLSVGDYDFDRKCVARIKDFKANGGTILFVSHNMSAVRMVADRCLWLHDGHVRMVGTPDEVIPVYETTPLDRGVAPEALVETGPPDVGALD